MKDPYTYTLGRYLQLPLITPEYRDSCKQFVENAKKIDDKEGADTVETLVDIIDTAEATLRNMYRSLELYRNNMPNLLRKLKAVQNQGGTK